MYVTINDPDVEHWVKIFTRIDFDPNVNRIYMVYRLSKFKVPMYHNLIISTSSSHILTNNKDLLQGKIVAKKARQQWFSFWLLGVKDDPLTEF